MRKKKASTLLQAKCDGMSVSGRGWSRKKEQDGTCKMLSTRSTIIGLRLVKGLQRKCSGIQRTARENLMERVLSPNESSVKNCAHCEAGKK